MPILSTGPLENNPVNGVRPTQQVTVRVDNRSAGLASEVSIRGYYLNNGTRVLYINEFLQIAAEQVITKNYFASFDAFEFVFLTEDIDEGGDPVQISVWGKDASGQLVPAHRLVSAELVFNEIFE